MIQKIKNLKKLVEETLERVPQTRNDDAYLTVMIISRYFPEEIIKQDNKFFVSWEIMREIREDNVKRIRAKIQNDEHRYLPTSIDVARKRKWAEEDWRRFLNYNPEGRTV